MHDLCIFLSFFVQKSFLTKFFFTFCWDKLDYPGSIVYLSCFNSKQTPIKKVHNTCTDMPQRLEVGGRRKRKEREQLRERGDIYPPLSRLWNTRKIWSSTGDVLIDHNKNIQRFKSSPCASSNLIRDEINRLNIWPMQWRYCVMRLVCQSVYQKHHNSRTALY